MARLLLPRTQVGDRVAAPRPLTLESSASGRCVMGAAASLCDRASSTLGPAPTAKCGLGVRGDGAAVAEQSSSLTARRRLADRHRPGQAGLRRTHLTRGTQLAAPTDQDCQQYHRALPRRGGWVAWSTSTKRPSTAAPTHRPTSRSDRHCPILGPEGRHDATGHHARAATQHGAVEPWTQRRTSAGTTRGCSRDKGLRHTAIKGGLRGRSSF